jgi:glutaredoxin-like protein NrdH
MDLQSKYEADVLLFALSTCAMCARVKRLLGSLGVAYEFIDVDLLTGEEKEDARNRMRKWHPRCPFPMLVIDRAHCVIGDEPDEIRKALGK